MRGGVESAEHGVVAAEIVASRRELTLERGAGDMMEEESSVDPKAHASPDSFGETLLYDFAKFQTTLSILTLGGVLTISQAADPTDVKPGNVIMAVIAIAFAATPTPLPTSASCTSRCQRSWSVICLPASLFSAWVSAASFSCGRIP